MKDYSQNGEQPHILEFFDKIGIDKGHAVDLGAGDGYAMSNVRALIDKGWTADLYDGDPRGAKDVKQAWIDRDTAQDLVPSHTNFLNLDLDGNDYWILDKVLEVAKPDLIVCEINPIWPIGDAKVIPYDPDHRWDGTVYYGMSLTAAERLAVPHGYYLYYVHAGINAFLVKSDHYHTVGTKSYDFRVKFDHAPDRKNRPWIGLRTS